MMMMMMMMIMIITEELCKSRRLLTQITASEMRFRLGWFTGFVWTISVKKIGGIKNTRIPVYRTTLNSYLKKNFLL